MNRQELRKPLLQSALVLLAILILIGFVAGSNADSFLGGIGSIFKGIFLTLLFAIGLILALVFSVALLFAIFLGAIAIYSPENSRDMFYALRTRTTELLSPLLSRIMSSRGGVKKPTFHEKTPGTATGENIPAQSKPQPEPDTTELLDKTRKEILSKIDSIGKDVSNLNEENRSLSETVSQLEETLKEMPFDQVASTTSKVESRQDELGTSLSDCMQKIEQISLSLQENDKRAQQQETQLKEAHEKITLLSAEIAELRTTPVPRPEKEAAAQNEVVEEHRIFSYLEKENEKKQFAELVEKAVEQDMTYTEIDEFLSQSLSKKTDTIIKEHPVLTKEYIRERRQKQ